MGAPRSASAQPATADFARLAGRGLRGVLWDWLVERITPETLVAFCVGILGIILGSQAALRWGYTHAYEFGRWLARRLPGHAIEHFLAEQARGLHDGLEAEHAAEALLDAAVTRHHERAGQVTTLTVTVRPKEGAATDEEARPTPAAGVRTPSQTDPL